LKQFEIYCGTNGVPTEKKPRRGEINNSSWCEGNWSRICNFTT